MNSSIFRQISLERLSSPEQLDQMLTVTGMRAWIALAAVLLLLGTALVWGFKGTVVTTASGTGVIVRQGGVLNIVSNGSGVVASINVKPGARVSAHQVIATVAQPSLLEQISLLERAREEAIRNRDRNLSSSSDEEHLKEAANRRERATIEAHIGELRERSHLLGQQIEVEKQLYARGLVTNQQVLDMRQTLVEVGDEIAAGQAHLIQLDAERFDIAAQPARSDVDWQMRVAELDREVAGASTRLRLAANVISPYDGEVLEVIVSPGSTVSDAQPIVSLQPRQDTLEVLAYLPAFVAKDLRVGYDAEVSPSNVKREEYGYMRGKVDYVANFPSTDSAMMRNFENNALVHSLSEGGPVTEVRAVLQAAANTPSGFAWSTSAGPSIAITSGTLCQVDVVTRRERPISLVFPYLRARLGY